MSFIELARIVAAVTVISGEAPNQAPAPAAEKVIWAGGSPQFIPASRFLTRDGDVDLSYFATDGSQHLIHQLLEQARNRPPGTCAPYSLAVIEDGFGWNENNKSEAPGSDDNLFPKWLARIQRSGVAVRGEVIEVVPGYSWRTNAPATLVRVRITRLYRQRYGRPVGIGGVLSFITGSGSLTVSGTIVCMTRPGEPSFHSGQQVIVSGYPGEVGDPPLDLDTSTDVLAIHPSGIVELPDRTSRATVPDVEAAVERAVQPVRRRP